ncbi:LytTR family DNA-binding domain-containing protein [Larkinella soli]|uniref:LytTR family DNA-binding domain-containing protein n=1 Tax=Larkinella soli TaxID=1770527 RepID=UPI0013E2C73D|nr:LytTR family DNA-binding domain-containing protein [Larkinella soli]
MTTLRDRPAQPIKVAVFTLRIGANTDWVYLSQIVRFEAAGSYSWLILKDGRKYLIAIHLARLARQLPGFVRVHRSHLVNREWILADIDITLPEAVIQLKTGERIPVSRRKGKALR